jgi:hypothetical protein
MNESSVARNGSEASVNLPSREREEVRGLPRHLVDRFNREGFLLVPGVLAPEEVSRAREYLEREFDREPSHPGDHARVRFDAVTRHPELRSIFFHPKLVASLRSILGADYVVLPECALHNAIFSTWHKDTTSQERDGHRFHWDPDYKMVEAAFYLQDNDPWFGGGLDVVPGSHVLPDKYAHPDLRTRTEQRLASRGLLPRTFSGRRGQPAYSTPSRAGDLLLFHFRIDHRATPARSSEALNLRRKLAIFLACSSNTKHVPLYTDYLRSRPDYVYLRDHRYPDEVARLAGEARVTLA